MLKSRIWYNGIKRQKMNAAYCVCYQSNKNIKINQRHFCQLELIFGSILNRMYIVETKTLASATSHI